jgi:hypothetical protein
MFPTLRDCVAEFVDKPPAEVRVVMIHLQRAKEREPLIEKLIGQVGAIEVVDAADGGLLVAGGHPTECGIDPGVVRTAGEVGCIVSHVREARRALADGISHLVVFEDDCEVSPSFTIGRLMEYFRRVGDFIEKFKMADKRDFILLGTCGCYSWQYLSPGLKATNNFNGSHAYIMGRPIMEKLVEAYDALLLKGQTAPTDGLLPRILQAEGRWSFCPRDDTALFRQNRSIPSYVVDEKPVLRLD